jgi:hypothetical protein
MTKLELRLPGDREAPAELWVDAMSEVFSIVDTVAQMYDDRGTWREAAKNDDSRIGAILRLLQEPADELAAIVEAISRLREGTQSLKQGR